MVDRVTPTQQRPPAGASTRPRRRPAVPGALDLRALSRASPADGGQQRIPAMRRIVARRSPRSPPGALHQILAGHLLGTSSHRHLWPPSRRDGGRPGADAAFDHQDVLPACGQLHRTVTVSARGIADAVPRRRLRSSDRFGQSHTAPRPKSAPCPLPGEERVEDVARMAAECRCRCRSATARARRTIGDTGGGRFADSIARRCCRVAGIDGEVQADRSASSARRAEAVGLDGRRSPAQGWRALIRSRWSRRRRRERTARRIGAQASARDRRIPFTPSGLEQVAVDIVDDDGQQAAEVVRAGAGRA